MAGRAEEAVLAARLEAAAARMAGLEAARTELAAARMAGLEAARTELAIWAVWAALLAATARQVATVEWPVPRAAGWMATARYQ